MGYTLNNFTRLGLVFSVGIVIDDAIVILEKIFHRTMEEKGWSGPKAASYATGEIALLVMATTLSLVVIFLPLVHEGPVGIFSYCVTVAFAIIVSLFVSFTLTPTRALRPSGTPMIPRRGEKSARRSAHAMARASLPERPALESASSLGHHDGIGVCFILIIPLAKATKFTFIPPDDSVSLLRFRCTPKGAATSNAPPKFAIRSNNACAPCASARRSWSWTR